MTDSGEKKTVFISYSSRYRYAAFSVEQFLKAHGYGVYWDDGLKPAQEWEEQLNEQIKKCEIFVYLLTPESIVSPHCRREYNQAAKHHKKFVPILLHPDAVLPPPIGKVQHINFTEGSLEEAHIELLKALENPKSKELSEDDLINDYANVKLLGFVEHSFDHSIRILDRIRSQDWSRLKEDLIYLDLLAKLINVSHLTTHIQHVSLFLQRDELEKAIDSAGKAKDAIIDVFGKILRDPR